jgi:hemoglobin
MKRTKSKIQFAMQGAAARPLMRCLIATMLIAVFAGCGTSKEGKKKDEFFTSGSRGADQRASQTMAKHEQIRGSEDDKKDKKGSNGAKNPAQAEEKKLTLFDRVGGEAGLSNIVADFVPRVLADPRVNWARKDVKRTRWFSRDRGDTVLWDPTPEKIETLKKHIVQFLAVATGGPSQYDGKELKPAHAGMQISNPEFDAAIGDLKASLDKLAVANKEQKELLAIVETTRPQIVTQR